MMDVKQPSATCRPAAIFLSAVFTCLSSGAGPAPDPALVYAWFRGDAGLAIAADQYTVSRWTNSGTQVISGISQAARDLVQLTGSPQKAYLRLTNGAAAGAVSFDGNDGIWAAKSSFGIVNGDRTVLAVVRVRNAEQGFLFDAASYTPGLTRAQVKTGYWHVGTSGATSSSYGPSSGSPTLAAEINQWQLHTFIVTTNAGPARFRHAIDGQTKEIQIATNGSLSGLMIGANASQQFGFRGEVAELMVFNHFPAPETLATAQQYLAEKWSGVTDDPSPPTPAFPRFVPVFTAGADGYTCFRIPALVLTTKGTLIALADGRIGNCGDIPTPLDLVCKRSFDHGKTWGPLQVVADYGTNPTDKDTYPFYGLTNVTRVAAGDPAILVDRTNGWIWTLYDNGGVLNGNRKIKLELRYSDDDGETWSPAIDVEARNSGIRPAYGEFLAGPGNGIQLEQGPHAGRLVFPVYTYGAPSAAMAIYSDDHGMNWRRGAAITNGGEIQVTETAGGGLLASIRDNGFPWSGVRTFSRSSDGGETWTTAYTNTTYPPTIPDPQCQGSILRLSSSPESNSNRIVHVNAADPSARVNLTVRMSYDEGNTWPVTHQVYAAGSAYSSVATLASGDLGILFEKDPYGNLEFTWRSVEQLTAGKDSLPPYDRWKANHFSARELMNAGISGPGADPDTDGFANGAEFTAGTDPRDATSYLELKIVPGTTNSPRLQFNLISNRTYSIERTSALSSAVWEGHTDVAAVSSNTVVQVTANSTNEATFFRLVTRRLP